MAGAVREKDSTSVYPPFVLGKPRFDQSTFYGRLKHFLDVVDPRTLFTSEQQLKDAIKLLEDYKEGKVGPDVTNKQLWEAQKIKQAIIHPDTGKKIFMPFRMSGFVPFGTITVTGLLLPNQTFQQMIFWQNVPVMVQSNHMALKMTNPAAFAHLWMPTSLFLEQTLFITNCSAETKWLNQSHNACVNYANRNASKPTPISRFVQGYIGAVTAAVGIAIGLNSLLERAKHFSPTKKMIVQRFIPFPAVSAASTLNSILMRYHELSEGIEVTDEEGNVVGTSCIAAGRAVKQTAITRALLPAPILVIPPIIMTWVEKRAFMKKWPRLHLPIQVVVCTACFGLALPVSIAIFPQTSEIAVTDLEPELQQRTTKTVLFYNKGL